MGRSAAMKKRAGGFQQQDGSEQQWSQAKGFQNEFAKIGRDKSLDGQGRAAAFKAMAAKTKAASFLSSEGQDQE